MSDSSIEEYRRKRHFERTPEPPPGEDGSRRGELSFVIQKHDASHLHYDFRLETDGVLKSWSVPKGPSLDPSEKRLAVMVEDHPLGYASFEGVIPKGEYGAGEVIVWDNGTYWPDEEGLPPSRDRAQELMRQGLASGKLSIFMEGDKLRGSWALVRMRQGDKNWLLIKHKDHYADPEREIVEEDRSVLTGRSLDDIAQGRPGAKPPARHQAPQKAASDTRSRPADPPAMPAMFAPMLASLTERAFSHPKWIFEPKLDGIRALARVQDGQVRLFSRSSLDDTRRYPSIVEALKQQQARELVLDGEIVAADEQGRPSFQLLQRRMHLSREADIRRAEAQVPVIYYVFDILYLDGQDLRSQPLERRKDLLKGMFVTSDNIRLVEYFDEDGDTAYEAAVAQGLEGVVAKRRDGIYESGRRSASWLKVKSVLSDEFIIGGFSRGTGVRAATFGSLLVGQRDDKSRLVYVSNVGTGFDDRELIKLRRRLDDIRQAESPFSKATPVKGPTTWVRPELVAEVKFASWTGEGSLRAPVFLRLADEKPPNEVLRASVVPPPSARQRSPRPASAVPPGDNSQPVLQQLAGRADRKTLDVEGDDLPVSNLNKTFWLALDDRPALTKRDLLVYLTKVSPYLLPHMRDRPITMTRYPEGAGSKHFYQKHWAEKLPEFVETVRVFSEHGGGDVDYVLCNNLATLLWLGQLADLELHTWYSRVDPSPDAEDLPREYNGSLQNIEASLLNHPDFIVFDMDPYIYSGKELEGAEPELNRLAFQMTCRVALWLKEILDSLALPSFVKTSGRTGLHVYAPILRRLDFTAVHSVAKTIGGYLRAEHPKEVTTDWAVARRSDKVFFDYNQNMRGKTLASIYSPRAMPEATVSMPIHWDEIASVYPTDFTIITALDRLEKHGDLWSGILGAKQDLGQVLLTPGAGGS